jgi:hypothetical protein
MSATIDKYIEVKCNALFTDANKQTWVDAAMLSIDQDCYGDKYNLAVALRACHDFTMSTLQQGAGSGGSGNLTSKREGDQAITFANNTNMDDDLYLQGTSYGRELLSIQKGTIGRISNTGCADAIICCTN